MNLDPAVPPEAGRGQVLVYMPDRGVGDLTWHLPTLRAIAATTPEGTVLLAARPSSRARDLLGAETCVTAIDYLEYRSGTWKNLQEIADFRRLCRARRPRAVWILEKIDRPAIGAALAGVPERRGFGLGHGQQRWLTHGPYLPKTMRPAHRIDKLAAFETAHGLEVASREPAMTPTPAALDIVEARFGALPRPWIVYGVGASETRKMWPLPRFSDLSAALSDLGGTRFWLGGFEDKTRVDEQLAGGSPAGVSEVNVCELKFDVGSALMSRADLFVGNDSGPMNVSASVGAPTLGLFGPGPVLDHSRFLHAQAAEDLATLEAGTVAARARALLA
ncbi:ADP-heptose--LPS heptosyltransferase [Caulobacter sp. D4A]|uniref:glycosyltransferase family 9 protein n=1 Tax=unclassified Caulobacter TaxID=2648921 RepID=UPI000D730626|nr:MULTISPECIES: glycosyltransferase family 9 protein [unclassified Caulobacter]PXA84639.1 ADP-heptose--LPS heptosyltransferase [Caulobacter sp. D4A]PXA94283.1 ADP-heptose--LPS heptosyltransferase [Caulobacter sp. D5]